MNVKTCLLLNIISNVIANVYSDVLLSNGFTADIDINEKTALPNTKDIAAKCFLRPTCFYGYKTDFTTQYRLMSDKVIFLNDNDLGDAGIYILEDLVTYLNDKNIILITNDDIYNLTGSAYFREFS